MKRIKFFSLIFLTLTIILLGFLLRYFYFDKKWLHNILSDEDSKSNEIIINFQVKDNLPLKNNNLPSKIILNKAQQIENKYRLVDILFNHNINLLTFQPLKKSQLLEILVADINIELVPYEHNIAKIYFQNLTIKVLEKIMPLEQKILQNIITMLQAEMMIDLKFQKIQKYLLEKRLNKYYSVLLLLVCY